MVKLGCLFPMYCDGSRLGQIFLSLCRNWKSERLWPHMIVPNASEQHRGPDLVEAIPRPLKWLAYRSAVLPALLTERRLLKTLDTFDAVYTFPDISTRTLRRIKQAGRPIILERTNCVVSKTMRILEPEYRQLAMEPENAFCNWEVEPERRTLELADFLFSPSPEVERSLLEIGIPQDKIIPTSYGWSPAQYPDCSVPIEPREQITVLFVGHICVRKGVHLLLEAWKRAGIDGRLVLCGPVEPALAPLLADSLARHDVQHLPYTSQIGAVYRTADIFAFPSLEEGGPLVTYEAMAHGLAVITSPMGAGAIVRNGQDGLVLEPHATQAWVDAFRTLAGSATLRQRFSNAARARAGEFTWDKVAKRRADAMLQKLRQA